MKPEKVKELCRQAIQALKGASLSGGAGLNMTNTALLQILIGLVEELPDR